MATTRTKGVCPHDCPDSCGLVTEVKDGQAVAIYGDPDHPVTKGWLCAKVRPYLDHVYHPDRLQYPLRRVGPKGGGKWQRLSWDEAVAIITERWQHIIDEFGAAAILPYSYSGTLGAVQMGVASSRFWNRLGASQLQRSICGAAAEMAVEATLGSRYSGPYEDVAHSKLVIIWGHNPVSTAPHFMPELRAAQRNGARLIVIDPRRTRTARGADWHLQPRPGTDGALALGLAHLLVAEGLHNEAWLAAHTVGWPAFKARLAEYPPARVGAITGIAASDLQALAQQYGRARPTLIKFSDGLQRNHNGGQTVRAICALPALVGQYGVRGGGLAYTTSGYLRWDDETINKWHESPAPARWVNMNRLGAALMGEVDDPPLKSLYVFGANPAAVAPNAGLVVAGLKRPDVFTVVHELFMTDTAAYADIVLPATSQLEQTDLHKGYGHTVLAYNRPAIAPLAACKSNWDVMRLLAAGMGFGEPWLRQSADEVIDELLVATARHNSVLAQVDPVDLRSRSHVSLHFSPAVPFSDGHFPTASGKVELFCQGLADMGLDPLPGYEGNFDDGGAAGRVDLPAGQSLNLISGAAHHFVSSSLANQPGLRQREGAPFVEIHPEDAAARDICDGDQVILENGRGWIQLRAVVTAGIRPGVLASPKGRWSRHHGGRNVNWTTSDAVADFAGQSTFHSNRVWLRRAAAAADEKKGVALPADAREETP